MSRPILQLHASRHCNLACRHCYSTSGPREKRRLHLQDGFFEEAFRSGIRILSISGGEPLLDPTLRRQVELARLAGLSVNLVSNGTLVTEDWAEWAAAHIDLIAISIDGPAALHDSIRAKAGAFDAAMTGLRRLRDHGARVGVIHTATAESLEHLRWLIELLYSERIPLLQIHPLEETGRATTEFAGRAKADLPSRVAYLAQLLAPGDALNIHVDAIPREAIIGLLASLSQRSADIVEFLSPLVVEADGRIVPWSYGITPTLALGQVGEAPLSALLDRYRDQKLAKAVDHQRRVAERILGQSEWPFVNWHAELSLGDRLPIPAL